MVPTSETEVVLEHALRNEEHLAVAALVGASYGVLCGRVIAGVVEPLAQQLAARLGPNWLVSARVTPEQLAERFNECLVARFTGHPADLRVVLAADETSYPKQPYIAVRAADPAKSGTALLDGIKKTVDRECRPGKSSLYSVWYRYAEKPHSGWGTPEGLVVLYRKTEAVTYYLDHLEAVSKAVEKALSTASG